MPIDQHLLQEVVSTHRRIGATKPAGFILGWTAFNHIYGAHSDANPPSTGQRRGDKAQMMLYAATAEARDAFVGASRSHTASFGFRLPLTDQYGRDVPPGLPAGTYRASDLGVEQYLPVMYEIRNSFVHGSQRFHDLGGQTRARFAESFADFLILLVKRVAPAVHV